MFCYNCGKELNDDFNLCPYCGADITRYSDETADKAKEYIVEPDVKFELLGRELFFSPRFLEYNTLRKRFFEREKEVKENGFQQRVFAVLTGSAFRLKEITYRMMMGEYILYYRGKTVSYTHLTLPTNSRV